MTHPRPRDVEPARAGATDVHTAKPAGPAVEIRFAGLPFPYRSAPTVLRQSGVARSPAWASWSRCVSTLCPPVPPLKSMELGAFRGDVAFVRVRGSLIGDAERPAAPHRTCTPSDSVPGTTS
jgi:hypothetical protein